jgi:hypothetical protein
MKFLKQLFCRHRYGVREWCPLDKEGKKLFKDVGLFFSCEKCGKFILLLPKIPKDVCGVSFKEDKE